MTDAGGVGERGSRWIVDLDGVVWLAGEAIGDPGAAVAALRARGVDVLFATNNSAPTRGQLVRRLGRVGIDAAASDLVTSAHAVAGLLQPGERVMLLGDKGLREALDERGVTVCLPGTTRIDAVVVGWTHVFDFDVLAAAAAAVRDGARLIGSNEDPVHPTPNGLEPGTGALLAAVATAARTSPVIAGKPHQPMVDLVRARLAEAGTTGRVLVVGDQPATDGRLAAQLGAAFALVDSGVTGPGTGVADVPVALRAATLGELVDRLLSGR